MNPPLRSGMAMAGIGPQIIGGHMLERYVQELMDLRRIARGTMSQGGMIPAIRLLCILPIAFPFVPWAEIRVSLLLAFGARIAGARYLATGAALIL